MDQIIQSLHTNVDRVGAVRWLRRTVRSIGAGFHIDTPPDEYVDEAGRASFCPADARRLARGLDIAARVLGRENFENLCLQEVWRDLGVRYDPVKDALVPYACRSWGR